MVVKVSSKNQVTIPKDIADVFAIHQGDFLEVQILNNKIVMTPKEMILEDKYPLADLEGAEKTLAQGLPDEEITFSSGKDLVKELRKRVKK